MSFDAPRDNLVRALAEPATLRDAGDGEGDGRTLYGHFAVFNRWTEIDSWLEGRFLERIAPGAFSRTIAEHRDRIRVLYDHGHDPSVGNKPLGTITDLREDKTGAYYEVDLFDAGYVNDLIPAARAGQLGASFRFRVVAEDRVEPIKSTKANPERLMERTITDVDLYEFGPVTFPAYADASAGVRSMTDEFMRYFDDPLFVARFTERVGLPVVEKILVVAAGAPRDDSAGERNAGIPDEPSLEDEPVTPEDPTDHVEESDEGDRAADGPDAITRTSTFAERQHMARQIQAQQMGLGRIHV